MNITNFIRGNIHFFAGCFFILFFVFIIFFTFGFSRSLDRWVFVFYNPEFHYTEREIRYLAPVQGREESLKVMVREILLGSFNPLYPLLWPRSTPLLSLFLEGSHLYANVGADILSGGKEEALIYLRRLIDENIRQNFSFLVDQITIAVEGERWDG